VNTGYNINLSPPERVNQKFDLGSENYFKEQIRSCNDINGSVNTGPTSANYVKSHKKGLGAKSTAGKSAISISNNG